MPILEYSEKKSKILYFLVYSAWKAFFKISGIAIKKLEVLDAWLFILVQRFGACYCGFLVFA